MSLSPENKSGNSFNLYLQKGIGRWEPSFNSFMKEVIPNVKCT